MTKMTKKIESNIKAGKNILVFRIKYRGYTFGKMPKKIVFRIKHRRYTFGKIPKKI